MSREVPPAGDARAGGDGMRVLTLCLDLFVDPLPGWSGPRAERLLDRDHKVWPPDRVRAFLEEGLGFGAHGNPPARVVRDHEAPLAAFHDLIGSGRLSTPFHLVQADAHTNLGTGDAGWFHVLGTLMHLPVEQRREPDPLRVTPENHLLFALAAEWLSGLDLVVHPDWKPDVLPILFESADPGTGRLQLRAYDRNLLHLAFEMEKMELPEPVDAGPAVPLRTATIPEASAAGPFDFVLVVTAPHFTPPAADALLDVVTASLKRES